MGSARRRVRPAPVADVEPAPSAPESVSRTRGADDDGRSPPPSRPRWRAPSSWPRRPAYRSAPTPGSAACSSTTTARTVAEGYHRGAGTPHAEADALARAGDARPRRHRRRDPRAVQPHRPHRPVREALVAAGVRRVVFAQADPNPVAAGGAARLRDGRRRGRARACWSTRPGPLNRVWTFAVEHGRPFVTWKFATTLDGRSAAADGTSRWVSGARRPAGHPPAAGALRRDAGRHQHRRASTTRCSRCATSTTGRCRDQPLRVVMGERDLDPRPPGLRRRRRDAAPAHPRPATTALAELFARDRQHVFLEGGPTLAAAFLAGRAGRRDRRLRRPDAARRRPPAVADLGITTIADALRLEVTDVTVLRRADGDSRTSV